MYPLIRFAKELVKFRHAPALPPMGTHVSTHICWPWDLDPWIELNNGRTLTLYDLGRIPLARRTGMVDVLRRNGWGFTVAGNSTRYRRRVRMFDRFTMVSRMVGWDRRFFYMEQSMWKNGDCCNHILIRMAVTSRDGIVAPDRLFAAIGHEPGDSVMPDWIMAWSEADVLRPWPPVIPPEVQDHLPA